MSRGTTRREFLAGSARLGVGGLVVSTIPLTGPGACDISPIFFTSWEWQTLQAAVDQIIPAEHAGDWAATDAGAHLYIDRLLASFDDEGRPYFPEIYAGGPTRRRFRFFQPLSRVKRIGWANEVVRLRRVYREGLAKLDEMAGDAFADAPALVQESILLSLDLRKAPLFEALYEHVMEGVYGHPAYGGNTGYLAWDAFCYAGDVHGVRFPDQLNPPGTVSDGAWNEHGGYAPEEMIQPGQCPDGEPV